MISTNITGILSSLSAEEIKIFRPYINSPCFNKNKNVISFFEYLVKFHPEFNDSRLNKESIFKKIFPGKPYNDGIIRTLTFQLNNLLKDFLIFSSSENSFLKKQIILLKEYNKRNLNKLFLNKFDELNSYLDGVKTKSEEYYLTRITMQREMEIFIEINRFMKKDYNSFKNYSFKFISENLTYYIYFMVISNYSFLFENEDKHLKDLSTDLLEIILVNLLSKENKFLNNPLLNMNQLQFKIHREKEEEHYKELKELFVNGAEVFDYFERYNLHNVLQHFCIEMIFNGKSEYRKERFYLYRISLDQKLYSLNENDYFDDMLFGNIVITAIAVSEIKWIEKFITEFSPSLSPEIRDTVVKYSNAKVSFARDQFTNALNYLNLIAPSNYLRQDTSIRNLILQCMYELEMINELHYQFDSYYHFLRSNKGNISNIRMIRIKNFLNNLKKLVKLKEKPDGSVMSDLSFELSGNTNIMERNWLIKKLSEIKV